ncbi:hypothetical protein LPJ75_006056, partial [Coemansia sp. RSA 2598]
MLGLLFVAILPVMSADSSDASATGLSAVSATSLSSTSNGLANDPEPRTFTGDGDDDEDDNYIRDSSSALGSELDSIDEPEPSEDDEGGIGIVGGFSGVSSFNPNNKGASLSLNKDETSLVALSRESGMLLESFTAEGQVTAG